MTAKPYHHGDLRVALLLAGRQFLKRGRPEDLSLRQLAREAGVSPNAPYRHFADRDALLDAVAVDGCRSLASSIAVAAGNVDSPAAAFANAYLGFAKAEPGVFRMIFTGTPSVAREEALQELFAEILNLVDQGGEPEQALRLAVGTWVTMHGAATLSLDGSLNWLDRWLRPDGATLVSAVISGLSTRGGR